MLGLMIFGAAGLYLAVLLGAVVWTWNASRQSGTTRRKAAGLSFAAFLALYLPVFWNHLPVAISFRAACAKDAGFHVRVPALQWLERNRERVAALGDANLDQITSARTTNGDASRYGFFGGLLLSEDRSTKDERFGMTFYRRENRVLDSASGDELIRTVDYSVGSREDIRLWLLRASCFPQEESPVFDERRYLTTLKGERT